MRFSKIAYARTKMATARLPKVGLEQRRAQHRPLGRWRFTQGVGASRILKQGPPNVATSKYGTCCELAVTKVAAIEQGAGQTQPRKRVSSCS